ncbi:GGDEF domain-containing protein [Methylopila jiangsuensis]|uniref:diguanylate cyclase n=1 Tax=Methylopila jiangsuensis TaxID=586230 RepID=A0A9W6N4H3_9HYPH|nr:GGDEF domain-containing protein [Methylopila jiangsuensis]MDR6285259.1 diguanylate cyclase (GGDEF)-like protein [Methylopila jiangsuensis]GLK77350.1 GGDEF domain-containing protein [Methylopila jiangsuensis]
MTGVLLLTLQALLYFGVMAALLRARIAYGVGLFVCALGVMHFLETYLAAVFFIELPFGLLSPGSTVLFSGKLMMFLLLYIREDAETVRQPIYGLMVGNLLLAALALLLRQHEHLAPLPGYQADMRFIDQIGVLMIWGTVLLFVDIIALILVYERLLRAFRRHALPALMASSALVLTFDQIAFFPVLHWLTGTPLGALTGGWAAKMGAAALYSLLIAGYLALIEPTARPSPSRRRIWDVFDALTYRTRYEDLLARSAVDKLTGAGARSAFEDWRQQRMERTSVDPRAVSVLMADVDHFKAANDRHGHQAGDEILIRVARALMDGVREGDRVYRYGGEEFVILCEGLDDAGALRLAERLRTAVAAAFATDPDRRVTISVGVATSTPGAGDIGPTLRAADDRLYAAKRAGRDRAVGAG